ncbi:MAG: carboxypeptidase regulatory-like domain-containing protein [Bacteroidetes bacterium]|nr:carboxypeptidase regulatory-like domain-containing protein [Bacteroidota bacterium]
MRNKILLLSFVFILLAKFSFGQSQDAALKGIVTDEKGQPAAFVNVEVFLNGVLKGQKQTDFDGGYRFDGLTPGTYSIKFTQTGYQQVTIEDYQLQGDRTATLNQKIEPPTLTTKGVVITGKKQIYDNNVTGLVAGKREIEHSPVRGVIGFITAQTPGGANSGSGLSIKGNRGYGTVYYVDGVKVIGNGLNLPQSSVEQVAVISGGIPAEYGDATGGIVAITTKGPSKEFTGGVDILSSQLTDNYGYNSLEASLSGPIFTKNIKLAGSDKVFKQPVLGFVLAGSFTNIRDGAPGYIPQYRVKESALNKLKDNPLRPSPDQFGIFVPNSNYITKADMEETPYRLNSWSRNINVTGKLNFQPTDNINITAGGSYNFADANAFIRQFSLFNFDNNPQVTSANYRGYVRFRHNLKLDTSIFNSAYYSVQFDYTKATSVTDDREFGDDYLNYGYIGKFEVHRRPFYIKKDVIVDGTKIQNSNVLFGYFPDSVNFTRGGVNKVSENYTQRYFDLAKRVNSTNQLRASGGLLNGDQPLNIYSLWSNVGTKYGSFAKSESEQYSVKFVSALSLKKKHNIKFGVDYEQQVSRGFSISTSSMWTLMRQLSNRHLTQFDTAHPILVRDGDGNFTDTINYKYQNGGNQSNFDRNMRNYLTTNGMTDEEGRKVNDQTNINTDRYSPTDYKNMAADLYKRGVIKNNSVLGMFSADEVLNSGNSYVNYYGYDYTGNKTTNKFVKPSNIGDEYVPYMNDPINPTANPIAFRNPATNRWYDANGTEVSDVTSLADLTGGQLSPYLAGKPNKTEAKRPIDASFKDYEPQVTFMPRISFSFPISERATVYANYNVLTQRPKTGNFATIDDYYFLVQRATGAINNPALRPERTTSYEIGLRQSLDEANLNSLSVQAYYSEIRDLIQLVRLTQAYPISYSSFGNVDFGTVKGAFVEYTMDKPGSGGISVTARYTMQFATGTGSEATSAGALIDAGQPNLRIPLALNYDVRHKMSATIDYRFGVGQDYMGATDSSKLSRISRMILEGSGMYMLITAASGTPYSKQSNVTQDVSIGIAQRRTLLGEPNGARLPWNYRLDATFDKNFVLGGKRTVVEGVESRGKMFFLNAYITVQNILNTQNIGSVYRYTGTAKDDGFLSSAEGQRTLDNLTEATAKQAYFDQYTIKVNNPDNYGAPRIIRLGLRCNF